ncbi:hypothetical protein [Streptomyces sp. Da 82-17]|uniref:hypothetical protein n=1 Tax=Streptomyces sp. Da 82-17 TaxID=3377116 RepID=UPI0038D38023
MAANDDPITGGVHINHVSGGAFAVGNNNQVSNVDNRNAGAPRDPAQEELLRTIRELRGDLARFAQSEARDALDAELADAEGEIERDGRAGPGRLGRLRQALTDGAAVTGTLASVVAVSQAVGALLGG